MQIFILTGAGISAESGLKTFRDHDGLWENHRIEDVATPDAFARDPDLVHKFYNERRRSLADAHPNPAHHAIGRLQTVLSGYGGSVTLVTQNVDDLHERGGAMDVIHMHGALNRALCSACNFRWTLSEGLSTESVCPACHTRGSPRPDIVWFGEMPYDMDRIEFALSKADLFVSIGTSGAVYPAAGFVQAASAQNTETIELNLEPSLGSDSFNQAQYGPAGTIVPAWVEGVIKSVS